MANSDSLLALQYTILGSALAEPKWVGEICARLAAEDFDTVPTRGLFEAISRLHLRGDPVDPVTVQREAGDEYGVAVAECRKYTVPEDLPYYCDLLREESQLRKLQNCAYDLAMVETMEAAEKAAEAINGLLTLRRSVEPISAGEAAADFIRRMSEREKPEYLNLKLSRLDKDLFIELGDFVLVGGYASAGKTLLSLQFALALAEQYRVGYFSLETGVKKLTDRLIAHLGQVPLSNIKNQLLSMDESKRAVAAARQLAKLNLDLIPAGGMSVRDIQATALNKRYQVIFVDYLQIVSEKGRDRYEQVTNISLGLHTLAQAHGVTVFALAQLSRPEKVNGKSLPPNLNAFRESGQLEQDADVAMLLWPSDLKNNNSSRKLKIAKNKDGARNELELAFDGALQTMTPVEDGGKSLAAHCTAVGNAAKARRRNEEGFQEIIGDTSPLPF